MYRIFALLFFVCGVLGQISLEGDCNYAETDYIQNLNLSQTYGTWHQIARIGNNVEIGECSSLIISKVNETGETVFTHSEVFNKTKITTNGTIEEIEESTGLLLMRFQNNITLNFVMLTTNHSGVAVIYSCQAFQNSTKKVWAWQYNRNATLSSDEMGVIALIVSKLPDLKNATWTEINHNSTACGTGAGVALHVPHILTILVLVFFAKEFL